MGCVGRVDRCGVLTVASVLIGSRSWLYNACFVPFHNRQITCIKHSLGMHSCNNCYVRYSWLNQSINKCNLTHTVCLCVWNFKLYYQFL